MRGHVAVLAAVVLALAACDDGPAGLDPLVVETVEVTPADRVIMVGDTLLLTALPRTADGLVLGGVAVEWSLEEGAAQLDVVNGYGRVVGMVPGEVRVKAVSGGKAGLASITVTQLPVVPTRLELTPQSARVQVDGSVRLEARLLAADGTVVGGRPVVWSSSHGPTATVHPDASTTYGVVTGLRPGTAVITARSEALTASAEIPVVEAAPVVGSVVTTPYVHSLWPGMVHQYRATVLAPTGGDVTGVPVTWSVEDPAVATVDSTGLVTTRGLGETRVVATAGGVSGRARVRVVPLPGELAEYDLMPGVDEMGWPRAIGAVDTTAWTDAQGVEHAAELWLVGGRMEIDRTNAEHRYRHEAKLMIVVRDLASGQPASVGSRTETTEGGIAYRWNDGAFMFLPDAAPGTWFIGRYRDAEHLVVEQSFGQLPAMGWVYRAGFP